MTPYYEQDGVTIYHGDCREVMQFMVETHDRVASIITDPPYSAHTHAKQWIGAALTEDGKPRVSTAHILPGVSRPTECGVDPVVAYEVTQRRIRRAP